MNTVLLIVGVALPLASFLVAAYILVETIRYCRAEFLGKHSQHKTEDRSVTQG